MSCVKLDESGMPLSFDPEDGLCTVCQRLVPSIGACWHHFNYFQIGTIGELMKKSQCPFCRLILASIRFPTSSGGPTLATTVRIQQRRLSFAIDHNKARDQILKQGRTRKTIGAYLEVHLQLGQSPNIVPAGTILEEDTGDAHESSPFDIVIPQYDTVQRDIRGRAISSTVNYSLIKAWMGDCDTLHQNCRNYNLLQPQSHNIRLVDVCENRIVISSPTERYVALSYVWGLNTTGALTAATLSKYSTKSGLQKATLPQTILDCIQLVRNIGLRYLWVDSLCILQDDDGDKLKHLPAMDKIYHYAHLVIVAATGDGAHAGLHSTRSTTQGWQQQRLMIRGLTFITGLPRLGYVLNQSTWNTRGWTFQEAILARRILFFTEYQLYWSCRCGNRREDMDKEIYDVGSLSPRSNSFWVDAKHQCRMAEYCRDVREFTKRQFSDVADAAWAFMGILRLHKTRFPKSFIWGLPIEKLDAALLWRGCVGNHKRQARHTVALNSVTESLNYPSWSWLPRDTAVGFLDLCGDNVSSQVTWHEPLFLMDSAGFPSHSKNLTKLGDKKKQAIPTAFRSASDVMSYGLLQLTAETFELTVSREYRQNPGGAVLPTESGGICRRFWRL